MPKQLGKFTTILVLIILSTSLNAQVDTTKVDKGVNINFFNGYAISYKWNASQSMSYRVYLGLQSSLGSYSNDFKFTYSENTNITGEDTEDGISMNMNLSFQFIFNIISQKSFNFYLGIGPSLNYSYRNWDVTNKHENQDEKYNGESTNTYNYYGIGVSSLVGIEGYLTNSITLFAETHLLGVKYWSYSDDSNTHMYDNSDNNSSEYSRTGSGWSANLQLVKVGLGIYF